VTSSARRADRDIRRSTSKPRSSSYDWTRISYNVSNSNGGGKCSPRPPYGLIYTLGDHELKVLREYLDKELKAGRIRPSESPAGVLILIVPKQNTTKPKLYVDCQGLNNVTVKNRYLLLLITKMLDCIVRKKVVQQNGHSRYVL